MMSIAVNVVNHCLKVVAVVLYYRDTVPVTAGDIAPGDRSPAFVAGMNRRVVELREEHPGISGVDVDLLFMAYLLETSKFGVFSFGPVTLNVTVVEERFVTALPLTRPPGPQKMAPSAHAFYARLGVELERAHTRRPNELHYLLAFMRSPDGLPAEVFGELAVSAEAVERFARAPLQRPAAEAFLTPEDVAVRLGVNVQTVRAWIRSGKLPASRLAGRRVLRIRESDMEAVLEPVDPSEFTGG